MSSRFVILFNEMTDRFMTSEFEAETEKTDADEKNENEKTRPARCL